jgi:hypothetical protein
LGKARCVAGASGVTYNNAERDSSSEIALAPGLCMIERLKQLASLLAIAAMLGFSLFQLYRAWRGGEIFFDNSGPARWFGFADDPLWYVAGTVFYGFASVLFGLLLAAIGYGWRVEERNLRRWFRRPPLDIAIREPVDREPGR